MKNPSFHKGEFSNYEHAFWGIV